jgi:hypothetical protein
MSKWRDSSLIPHECRGCCNELSCRGGCRVAAKAVSNRLDGTHPYYQEPLTTQLVIDNHRKNYENKAFTTTSGALRYRDEEQDFVTVYFNPHSFATLNPLEFDLFRLIYSEKYIKYSDFLKKIGMKKHNYKSAIQKFEERRLIKQLDKIPNLATNDCP